MEYYSANNRNKLPSYKEGVGEVKLVTLEKVAYSIIPSI